MVTSFKSTFIEWLENRIFAEYYINIANEGQLNKIKDLVFQKSENKETNYFSQDALLTYLLIACVFIIWFIFS